MSNEITLPIGASAEPDTCGSCKFFRRKDDYLGVYGFCRFRLPPQFALKQQIRELQKNYDYTGNEDQIADTDRCDLYRHDGKVYIVQRRIPPERIG